MKECSICYEKKKSFFQLTCCSGYHICTCCSHKLRQPSCPFCREPIIGLKSLFLNDDEFIRFYDNYSLWGPMEEIFLESKWYRRHYRRLKRLRDREEHNTENRIRSQQMNNQRRQLSRQQQRKDRKYFIRNLLHDISNLT